MYFTLQLFLRIQLLEKVFKMSYTSDMFCIYDLRPPDAPPRGCLLLAVPTQLQYKVEENL